jgi:hypothetical protein
MKKQIEQSARIPIRQQEWTGLLGAIDSVRFKIRKNEYLILLSLG